MAANKAPIEKGSGHSINHLTSHLGIVLAMAKNKDKDATLIDICCPLVLRPSDADSHGLLDSP